jgi:FMN reductase
VDIFDPVKEQLGLFNPDSSYTGAGFAELQARVEAADVLILGTPDYHGSISSTLKNFLDHFWEEFAGKLFASIVASHEKGLTVTDQLRTVARQCYAWSMPYGVSFNEREDLKEGVVSSEQLKKRLEMLVQDICNYGTVIGEQRLRDLNNNTPGFLARYRAKR